jgi:hypothetical protein
VFSCKHLQEKRLKRVEEDATNEAKAKARSSRKCKNAKKDAAEATTSASTIRRGWKRKSTALEVGVDSLNVGAKKSVPKRKVARVSDVQVAEATGVQWIAPFAKMY